MQAGMKFEELPHRQELRHWTDQGLVLSFQIQ